MIQDELVAQLIQLFPRHARAHIGFHKVQHLGCQAPSLAHALERFLAKDGDFMLAVTQRLGGDEDQKGRTNRIEQFSLPKIHFCDNLFPRLYNPWVQMRPLLSPDEQQLLDILLNQGAISQEQAQIVLTEKRRRPDDSLETILLDLAFLTEKALHHILSERTGIRQVSLKDCLVDPALIAKVPRASIERFVAVPLYQDEKTGHIILAMADADDLGAYDHMRQFFPQHHLEPVLALRSEIFEALPPESLQNSSLSQLLARTDHQAGSSERPIARLLDLLLWEAFAQRASDIHLEPEKIFVRARYRIDGLMVFKHLFHGDLWSALSVRIKVLAGMNITETRRPQDGRFSVSIQGKEVDCRVASHPTVHGENMVIRLLQKQTANLSLDQLGFSPDQLTQIQMALTRPEGLFIVTGPTGSGKTTTLYAVLQLLDAQTLSIMTLEQPVEYHFPHIRQTEIKENGPLSFADGVKSILRQDPDVILIGELRDQETAHMALRASMTGHRVLTTLHTNNALGALFRFMDFDLPLSLVAGNIIGVLAQRLVRTLCGHCKTPYGAKGQEALYLKCSRGATLYEANGCEYCNWAGYRGRQAVSEILLINSGLERLLLEKAPLQKLQDYLTEQSMVTLQEEASALVIQGITSIKEIQRVVGGWR